jgi:lipopolysaccharide/colanic/teichoic acid biosynthesis glycosyltransferase
MYRSFFKRFFDVVLSLLGILLVLPLGALTYVALFIGCRYDPIFKQERPGKDQKIFEILKFRTMNSKTGPDGKLLPDSQRLTRLGKFLRRMSLDEIPQLYNVLKGDMSLIGPRPLRVRFLKYYTAREKLRHSVKPGVTGLAQVSGRNSLGWDRRLELDVEYVSKCSFTLDFLILLKTVRKVLTANDTEFEDELDAFDVYRSQHGVKSNINL